MRFILYALACCAVAAHAEADRDAQFARIDAAVANFAPQTEGHTDVYFLGFAGDGEQRVFAEEIKLAAQRVGAKYGSTNRSLLLINDRRDLVTYPLATGLALGHALQSIARVMNRNEDILFLALSSHGTRAAQLVVDNTDMPERGLEADDVAQMLRDSGIRWQVVVVSACFSGLFIEPLAHSETIVITAASKTRTSFGCSDDRDLTYFGEAFYRDALPGAARLRDAVETTRKSIRVREKEEGVKPSRPQSYFGPLLDAKLAAIESGPGN